MSDTLTDAIARVRKAAKAAKDIYDKLPTDYDPTASDYDERPTVMGIMDRIMEEMARQEHITDRVERLEMAIEAAGSLPEVPELEDELKEAGEVELDGGDS
jgi:hypothetical protein